MHKWIESNQTKTEDTEGKNRKTLLKPHIILYNTLDQKAVQLYFKN